MHDMIRKTLTVAFAAVLLFCSVVPVPTGAAMFDRVRMNRAYANPVAGTAAEMALLAFETMCVAGGLYIAGSTLSELNVNAEQLYQDFSDYYTAQNNISQSELEAMMAGSYLSGNVDLTALATAGAYGALPAFYQWLVAGNGQSVVGANATSSNSFELTRFPSADKIFIGEAPGVDLANTPLESSSGWRALAVEDYGGNDTYVLVECKGDITWSVVSTQGNRALRAVSTANIWSVTYNNSTGSTIGSWRNNGYQYNLGYIDEAVFPSHKMYIYDVGTSGVLVNGTAATAVATSALSSGTLSGVTGVVEAFNPTAEQLQAGYDASIIQGIEQANTNLGTISTGIAALDATMNGLLGVCQGIASTLSNTVVGQYCAAVTQWLGATPFGTVMGTVIDGLDAIPDSVADGAAVVAGGVAALPGALEGVIEGVLEGVFGQPLAIPGFLQDILAGVQAIPGALEGAIEGINFPGPEWPELPRPESGGEPFQIALPPAMQADFEADLRERVPFCYVIHMKDAVDNLSGNLSYSSGAGLRAQSNYNMRSFYFDVDIPFAGPVHFDAEPFLSQPFGALDIATTIRILATALLCFGLLYRSYKVVERSF